MAFEVNNASEIKAKIEAEFYYLHRHPELSYEEVETTRRLKILLTAAKIRVLDLPLKTGLVAEIGQGEPVAALRADIDALPIQEETDLAYQSEIPGKMHACGHDFHTAAVLGAALILKQQEAKLKGTVKIIFQPAEEAPGGARLVLATGTLKNVKAIFGLHVLPTLDAGVLGINEGAVTASVDRFVIKFVGHGTHAAHPDRGIDPIPLLAAFVQSAQTIVSRNLEPFAAGLVSITHVEAGNTWNIIPESATVEGTTRSMTASDRQLIKRRLCEMAESMAKAYGADAEIDWYAGPPATDNCPELVNLARKVANLQGFEAVEAAGSLAGEDFAFYQEEIPGVFVLVGSGKSYANHNAKFQIQPQAIYPTAVYLAELVEKFLQNEK